MKAAELEKQWYEALFEEDCIPLMNLLEEDPRLLKVGWERDLSRQVEGSPRNHRMPRTQKPWMGRTALHVAVRRGCVQLVKQILIVCGLEEISKLDEQDDAKFVLVGYEFGDARAAGQNGNREYTLADDSAGTPGQLNQGEMSGEIDATLEGDHRSILESAQVPEETKSMAANHADYQLVKTQEIARRTVAHWKSQVKPHEPQNNLLVNRKQLRELLLCKDGEYRVEALAMATINGNMDLVDLLVYAIGECENPPYYIKRMAFVQRDLNEDEKEYRSNRSKLREITQRIILEFELDEYHRDIFREYQEAYNKHRDFNFLLKEDYLIHFCFSHVENYTNRASEFLLNKRNTRPFYEALSEEIRKCGLSHFLLSFQDGQGRPPSHAAIDESLGRDFFEGIEFFLPEVHFFAMTALDGAGRTSLHRAAATGHSDVIQEITMAAEKDFVEGPGEVCAMFSTPWTFWDRNDLSYEALSLENGFREVWSQCCVIRWTRDTTQEDYSTYMLGNPPIQHEMSFMPGSIPLQPGITSTSGTLPIQEAIIHKHARCAREIYEIFNWAERGQGRTNSGIRWVYSYFNTFDDDRRVLLLDIMELACLVPNNLRVVDELLKAESTMTSDLHFSSLGDVIPALHIVAASGNYKILERFLDHPGVDTFEEDEKGNTALHHALDRDLVPRFKIHLLDYVGCQHLLSSDQRELNKTSGNNLLEERQKFVALSFQALSGISPLEERQKGISSFLQALGYHHLLLSDQGQIREIASDTPLEERQGCVNLLLQAGCDIFKSNNDRKVPYPRGSLSENGKFLSWWHEKQGKEFAEIQNGLSIAANAISVTAVLVATASYVGPLQPPLGLGTTGSTTDQMQDGNGWVATFIFCDTLSFYLAIVAITLSLIPTVPMPQQPMADEIRRTRVMVTLAVSVLSLSIICVLVAFASSSMAVVSHNIISGLGAQLTIATFCFGGLLILLAFLLFYIRLLGLLFPKRRWIRSVYKATSF